MWDLKSNLLKSSTLVTALVFSLMGCQPAPQNEEAAIAPQQVLFVKGNPENLIKGARLQPKSPFTKKNIMGLNGYSLMNLTQFVEKEKIQPIQTVDQKQLEKENESKDQTQNSNKNSADLLSLKVKKSSDNYWILSLLGGALQFKMEDDTEGGLQITSLGAKDQFFPVQVLHWSTTPDQRFMSVLFLMNSEDSGKSLGVVYFEKTTIAQTLGTTDKKYIYLAGPGNKIPWKIPAKENLNISLCGDAIDLQAMQKSVDLWSATLGRRVNLKLDKKTIYGPFSDLNEHCVQMIDSYIYDPNPGVAVYGATIGIKSLSKGEMVDSDIFMFAEEFKKLETVLLQGGYPPEQARARAYQNFPLALRHEIGHFLGLNHKFDGTPSIMSYDFKFDRPQAYDIEALAQLYPLK